MLIKNSDQVCGSSCDMCGGQDASTSKGYALVAKGATGRFCEVMWLCDDCGDKADAIALDVQEAREKCTTEYSYADF